MGFGDVLHPLRLTKKYLRMYLVEISRYGELQYHDMLRPFHANSPLADEVDVIYNPSNSENYIRMCFTSYNDLTDSYEEIFFDTPTKHTYQIMSQSLDKLCK